MRRIFSRLSHNIDWTTFDRFVYIESATQSVTLTQNSITVALSNLMSIPDGYDAVSVTPIITGGDSTQNAIIKVMVPGGDFRDASLLVGVASGAAQTRTWEFRVKVLCMKRN